MSISDFLRRMHEFYQSAYCHDANLSSWSMAYFLYDVLEYISGKNTSYGIDFFYEMEGESFFRILDMGQEPILWAGADTSDYGFQITDKGVYLPYGYSALLPDLACRIYGNTAATSQQAVYKEIQSFGFKNRKKQSVDMENLLQKNVVFQNLLELYEEYFYPNGTLCGIFTQLVDLFFNSLEKKGEYGINEWRVLCIKSSAIDAWLRFLKKDIISEEDRRRSERLLNQLVSEDVTMECQSHKFYSYSHDPSSPSFYQPYNNVEDPEFSIIFYQNAYGLYNYGESEGLFWFGLVSLEFLAVMLDTKDFLMQMDKKYHFYKETA